MYRSLSIVFTAFLICALMRGNAVAKAFEPEFTVTKIVGSVNVKTPDARKFTDAEVGRAYAYGTTVQTEKKAEAVITLSEGNVCRILAKTTVTINENTENKLLKIMNLSEGKLDMTLDQMVQGQELHIETAAAVCGITGTDLVISSEREHNVNATDIQVSKVGSSVKVWSEYFSIPEILADREVMISMTDKRDYIRIRIIKGQMKILLEGDNNKKEIPVDTGSLIKIFIKEYADYIQVTGLVYDSDQAGAKLVSTVSIRKKKEKKTETGGKPSTSSTTSSTTTGTQPKAPKDRGLPTIITPTSSTTTIPDTTPKGLK